MTKANEMKVYCMPVLASIVGALILFPQMASGQPAGKCYGAASYGLVQVEDESITDDGTSATQTYDRGYSLGGALGCQLSVDNSLRGQLELDYSSFEFDSLKFNGSTISVSGDIDVMTWSLGGYWDLPVSDVIMPYVGGGVGWSFVELSAASATAGGTTVTTDASEEDYLSTFAEVGVGIDLSETVKIVPNIRFRWLDNEASCGAGCTSDANIVWAYRVTMRVGF